MSRSPGLDQCPGYQDLCRVHHHAQQQEGAPQDRVGVGPYHGLALGRAGQQELQRVGSEGEQGDEGGGDAGHVVVPSMLTVLYPLVTPWSVICTLTACPEPVLTAADWFTGCPH